jgi:hypothetical protein
VSSLRTVAVGMGRLLGRVVGAAYSRWRSSRVGLSRGYDQLAALRRKYVFGGISRQTLEEAVRKAGRRKRPKTMA